MFKKIALLLIVVLVLTACEPVMLNYKEKSYDTDTLAELIESELQTENPEYDLDVTITIEDGEE